MNINNNITNTNNVLLIVISVFFLLSFPLIFNVYLGFNGKKKVFLLKIKLFFIKIVFIKVIYDNGLYLIKGKKVEKITVNILKKLNNDIEIIKDYHVLSIDIKSEIGDITKYYYYVFYNLLINKLLLLFLTAKKPYVTNKNEIEIKSEDIFNVNVKVKIVINLLIIVLSIVKIIIRKFKEKWKDKKTELKTLLKRQ